MITFDEICKLAQDIETSLKQMIYVAEEVEGPLMLQALNLKDEDYQRRIAFFLLLVDLLHSTFDMLHTLNARLDEFNPAS